MKLCFVTVGATASFEKLVQAVLQESFLAELEKYNFTHLLVQYGKGGQHIFEKYATERVKSSDRAHGLDIGGFDLRPSLTEYLRMVQEDSSKHQELGMVISHAGKAPVQFWITKSMESNRFSGTGSILAALRASVPLVVVPNPDLADNHQQELADELACQGYAVIGNVADLPSTVGKAANRRERAPFFLNASKNSLDVPLSDELSFVD
ncbi:UDP-N-acetylglucosamine transferase subunit alg13 [Penicillium canariense]|uniref:UDP-N-acetylglucosamine transferase subunit ALG13 n=1 Tax=Penicillium canariense TaxID=189055 RepID=A0A9W9LNN9_9EURO|nr:UDP-N-acetylglucosamine transferase subunit alg13 [Penicillium canariense]KAJ5168099.1 UDP-N-acetylglucosamine transferase subunit alg13 [Penicillium canariense]